MPFAGKGKVFIAIAIKLIKEVIACVAEVLACCNFVLVSL